MDGCCRLHTACSQRMVWWQMSKCLLVLIISIENGDKKASLAFADILWFWCVCVLLLVHKSSQARLTTAAGLFRWWERWEDREGTSSLNLPCLSPLFSLSVSLSVNQRSVSRFGLYFLHLCPLLGFEALTKGHLLNFPFCSLFYNCCSWY